MHARASAFPLGFAVLARGGVTAWRHALARTAGTATPASRPPDTSAAHTASLPATVATELISVLAAVALAATGPAP